MDFTKIISLDFGSISVPHAIGRHLCLILTNFCRVVNTMMELSCILLKSNGPMGGGKVGIIHILRILETERPVCGVF